MDSAQGKQERSNFSGRIGFVLAASASAVGLGNLWRFPYLAAKYGGGAFLITYLFFVITFGFALMLAEVALGRNTKLSAIGAFKKFGKKYAFIGILISIVPMIITPYYSVIGGWILKYFAVYVTGGGAAAAESGFFGGFISLSIEPLIWACLFVLLCGVVVYLGIQGGIERLNKFLMPALLVILVLIIVYVLMSPGAWEGVKYYIIPNFENFGLKTAVAAMGQMFFSMSLAMGIMITYGSYLRKEDNLETSVTQIEFFDTGVSFLAGLMIIPAVFAFSGGEAGAVNAGPGLMFMTLPKVFSSFPITNVLGTLFFLLVLFAAFTSAISLYETIVSIFQDRFKWQRRKCVIIVGIGVAVFAAAPSLGFGLLSFANVAGLSILDIMDFMSNSVLMPIVALLTCLFVGWWVGPGFILAEVDESETFRRKRVFLFMIRWGAPVCLIVIFVSYVLSSIGIISL